MALFRKFFYRKPPDGLLEIAERVYVFDCCFTTNALDDDEYKVYIGGIANQVKGHLPDASFMVFNFREGEKQSLISKILSEYDMTVMDYPRHYEGCPLLTMEMIHHFLRSSESWLSLGQQNVLLMHCERGGWPVLAFMLAALLIYRKQYVGEQKTLDMIYKQAPQELLLLMSPLNPMPSQLRYLQYISRRNVASEWPPLDRALTLDCIIIRFIPNMDGEGGCRPIFRIYGQDPFMAADRTPKVLFSTPKRSKFVRHHKQEDCELVKIDIHCHIQGDVVLECISLDNDLEREEIMFRVMFNTAFIRSNILMFSRDDLDILWNAKDQFPKDFRAEVLFSEMDAETSLISVDLPNIEEKEGLPIEAFNKVQEIFSNMNWIDPKTQQISSPKTPKGNMVEETGNFAGPEELKAEPKSAEDDLQVYSLNDQKDQSIPCSKPSSAADSAGMTIQRSSKSMIVSFSAPVSHSNSLQGSLAPISRYHSSPSAIGITALLHDHSTSESCQVISPEAVLPSSSSISPSLANVFKPLEPIIVRIPPSPLLTPPQELFQLKPSDETKPSEILAPTPSPPPPPPLAGSLSSSPVKQASLPLPPPPPAAPPPPPPPPFSSDIITLPPPAFSTILSSRLSNSLSTPPPPPASPSVPSGQFSASSRMPRVSNSLATPSPPTPPPPPPLRVTSGPLSFSSRMPRVSNSLATPPPPPPPPSPPSVPSGPFSVSSRMPRVSDSIATPSPPPPPPLPSVPSGPFSVSSRMPSVSNSLATPPPPPPPPSVPSGPFSVSSRMPSVSNSLATPPPPPLPPPSVPSGAFSVSSRLPIKNLADKFVPLSPPPPPPPPNLNSKESASNNHALTSPIPPPPAPLPNGLTKAGDASSSSRTANSKIPAIPGPPSCLSFNSKGRAPPRTAAKNLAQGKKSNLKPYHWLKLTRAVQGSLWAEAQKTDEVSKAPDFDMSELESLFAATAPNSDNGRTGDKSKRRASANKADKVQLIELRRANNCEIMLTKVKIPLPDLMSSVLALDEAALDADQIENLIKFCPTKEEMELLKGYGGDKENLGKCEQFFLELMKIPRVEPKLRVFSFKIQFRSQVSDLRTNLNIVNSASEEIKSSVKLKKIMQTILSLGNALNHGTARGSAVGFRLDSLLKLADTRARNNRMTLMHYLCKVLAEKLPELLDFSKDLKNLEASTKIQLKYLAEEMQAISKGIEKVVQELTFSDNDGPVSENFSKTVKGFLNVAEAEVRSLTLLYSTVGRNADALAFYFGEDPARCPFEQVVSTLLNFVKMFSRAHEENCKQIEYEKKKAQKEAENEKTKIGSPRKVDSDRSLSSPMKNRGIT